MPQLAPVIDSLDKVAEPLRTYYVQKDGKYHLDLNGAPSGFAPAAELAAANAKVVEFRDNNIQLKKTVDELTPLKTKFEGIDPDAAKSAITELAAIKAKGITKPDDIAEQIKVAVSAAVKPLQTQIEESNKAVAAERKRADDSLLRSTIGEKFTAIGGNPTALDFIVLKARDVFQVDSGSVKAQQNKFSTDHPGDPITVDEWLKVQTKESDFAFKPSNGSGAENKGATGSGGLKPGQTALKDPTPAQLGDPANVKGIREGKIVVQYSGEQQK